MKIRKLFILATGLIFGQWISSVAQDTIVIVESTQPQWAAGTINNLDVSSDTLRLDTVRTYHFNFTNCGTTGRTGPSQANANTTYSGTDLNGAVTVVDSGLQQWQTPEAGIYRIMAAGAGHNSDTFIRGAIVRADFELAKGTGLNVLVGQMGNPSRAGNGGAFVTYADTTPLIIAGGAGGMRGYVDAGNRGSTSTAGQSVTGPGCSAVGGEAGAGGQALGGGTCSGAGGGLLADGDGCGGGKAFIHYGSGGGAGTSYPGGYGGGGGVESSSSPGGGGGYSGGSVHYTGGTQSCAGGGGSFIAANGRNVKTSDGNYDGKNTFNGDTIESFNNWHIGHGSVTMDASKFITTGDRISPVHDISTPSSTYNSSRVDWNAEIFTGTSLVVETRYSTDAGSTWSVWNQVASSGSPVPGLLAGTIMDSARLQTRMTLATAALFASPLVHSLTVTVINDTIATGFTKLPDGLEKFSIYPNPFENTLKITYSLSKQSYIGLRLYSMLGQTELKQKNFSQSAGQHSFEVNLSDLQLSPGLYWIELLIDGQSCREKLLHY